MGRRVGAWGRGRADPESNFLFFCFGGGGAWAWFVRSLKRGKRWRNSVFSVGTSDRFVQGRDEHSYFVFLQ